MFSAYTRRVGACSLCMGTRLGWPGVGIDCRDQLHTSLSTQIKITLRASDWLPCILQEHQGCSRRLADQVPEIFRSFKFADACAVFSPPLRSHDDFSITQLKFLPLFHAPPISTTC